MERYARVLIIIFFLCLINLGLSIFVINKLNSKFEVKPTSVVTTIKPTSTPFGKTPTATDSADIKSDLTLIKAEIRALREILGTTRSFEELSNLIKTLNTTEP